MRLNYLHLDVYTMQAPCLRFPNNQWRSSHWSPQSNMDSNHVGELHWDLWDLLVRGSAADTVDARCLVASQIPEQARCDTRRAQGT